MKTIVYLIIIMACNISVSQAQTYKISQLAGTKWQCVETFSNPTSTWEFSKTEIKETVTWTNINKTVHFSNKYYFSQTIPAKFDWNKVGKGKKGKYLVYYVEKSERMFYLRIESISNDTLKFWHERDPEAIGGHSSYVFYKRIK